MVSEALAAGFDYVEPGANAVLDPTVTDSFAVTNLFFPSGTVLYGPEANYQEYAERLFPRAQAAGLKTMVIGSGAARRSPEGVAPEVAEARFIEIVAELEILAVAHGIHLCPENLNRSETDVWNSMPGLAAALNSVGVGFCADIYHIDLEKDELPNYLARAIPSTPLHVHFAGPGRFAPDPDDPFTQAFVSRLREVDYTGRVSFEGNRRNDPASELLPLSELLSKMKACFAPG